MCMHPINNINLAVVGALNPVPNLTIPTQDNNGRTYFLGGV